MTPEQFLDRLSKKGPESVYLFLGPEGYNRERCRRALLDAVLPTEEDREGGFSSHELDQISLAAVFDDARALSLFAARRVIWLARAELALPRGRGVADADEEGAGPAGVGLLEAYLREPT